MVWMINSFIVNTAVHAIMTAGKPVFLDIRTGTPVQVLQISFPQILFIIH